MTTSAQKQAGAARRAANRERARTRGYPRVRARPIHAGRRYKITRCCIGRVMLLSHSFRGDELKELIGYCLAYAANFYGIEIHASVWMSNHQHTDVTDPHGNLPLFKQLLHSLIARGRNAQLDRRDTFWSGDNACDTRRPTDDEALTDLVYTLTNPVKDGLVKWSCLWPGFTTSGWRFGETRTFERPDCLFNKRGQMPDKVTLTLVRPPIFRELDDDALYDLLMTRVRAKEIEFQRERREKGLRFLGLRKLEKQRWNSEPRRAEDRFKVAPKYAASSEWLVLAELQRDREWERQYATARAQLRAGERAVFPAGTYWLSRFAGVEVAAQPP